MQWIALALFMVILMLHVFTCKGRFWTKSLLVPLLILYYCLAVPQPDFLIIMALLAGLSGDVLLYWPQKQVLFMFGLGSFLIGHLFYAVFFLMSTNYLALARPELFLLVLPYLLYAALLCASLSKNLGSMKGAVILESGCLPAPVIKWIQRHRRR